MKRKHLELIEDCFVILGILFFSGALARLGIFPRIFISLIRWVIAFSSLFLMVLRFKYLAYKFRRDIFLIAAIFLVFISFNWSDFPDQTFHRVKSEFFPMTSFGFYLATSFDIHRLLKKISFALAIGLVLSWVTAIAVPSIGQASGKFAGAFVGVYSNKNQSSAYMVLTALSLILASFRYSSQKWFGTHQHIWLRYLGLSAFVFVFLTTSGTGLVLSMLLVFNLFLYSRFRWKGKITILVLDFATTIFGSLAIIIIGNWQELLTGLGKDPTLTGRTVFWEIAIQKIVEDRPFFGFGRGAFWAVGSPYPQEISRAFGASIYGGGYVPAHAHNGFIELGLDIGLIGLGLFSASFLMAWIRSFRQGYSPTELENLFPLGFMIFFTINNLTESLTVHLNHLFWPLYIAIAFNAGYVSRRYQSSSETKRCVARISE
ncbi:MAG: O-antigen ligase family protein [Leptolyngbya sp. SIO1D8]|nr:O-antigen ligase family protein [Leptolyngbya sp. SIO1D8]